MRGLELSREYFFQVGLPAINEHCPEVLPHMATGLVGDGSECFGFDDRFSRDHDWGAAFVIWLDKDAFCEYGQRLGRIYDSLPGDFMGYPRRVCSDYARDRVGVLEIGAFYAKFLGRNTPPVTLDDWRRLPEQNLAVATNGEVFMDNCADFTRFREMLLEFYPRDVMLKKMAARAMSMGQSGGYNYLRCAGRGEWVACEQALARFINNAVSMVFLINKRYRPFYKWMHRALKNLPVLGEAVHQIMNDIVLTPAQEYEKRFDLTEEISSLIIECLKQNGLTTSHSDFILDHAEQIQLRIDDEYLRNLHPWAE